MKKILKSLLGGIAGSVLSFVIISFILSHSTEISPFVFFEVLFLWLIIGFIAGIIVASIDKPKIRNKKIERRIFLLHLTFWISLFFSFIIPHSERSLPTTAGGIVIGWFLLAFIISIFTIILLIYTVSHRATIKTLHSVLGISPFFFLLAFLGYVYLSGGYGLLPFLFLKP